MRKNLSYFLACLGLRDCELLNNVNKKVTLLGIEPRSKEPESFILSVELQSQIQLKVVFELSAIGYQLSAVSNLLTINY